MSNNAYVHQYERDLIDSIDNVMFTIGVNEKPFCGLSIDLKISMEQEKSRLPEEFWAICAVLPAQILGFYKSLTFGLSPDSPSVSGVISRVVEGVQLYDYEESK
jgi:tagatose-6-phosphate ketose/aldose isomerase